MSYQDAYQDNHVEFEIDDLEWEDDATSTPNFITFEYESPAVSVDTAGRFVNHEIIGGSTVRQKIGEEPVEVSVTGVCKESTAKEIDNLRNAKYGTIFSNRLTNSSLRVNFASSTTSPLTDSGAVGLTDDQAEFLYEFTLECVEVTI